MAQASKFGRKLRAGGASNRMQTHVQHSSNRCLDHRCQSYVYCYWMIPCVNFVTLLQAARHRH